jgi:hypothetical protein
VLATWAALRAANDHGWFRAAFRNALRLIEDKDGRAQDVACVLAGKLSNVPLPQGFDDESELAQVVHVARPARTWVVDRRASLLAGRAISIRNAQASRPRTVTTAPAASPMRARIVRATGRVIALSPGRCRRASLWSPHA